MIKLVLSCVCQVRIEIDDSAIETKQVTSRFVSKARQYHVMTKEILRMPRSFMMIYRAASTPSESEGNPTSGLPEDESWEHVERGEGRLRTMLYLVSMVKVPLFDSASAMQTRVLIGEVRIEPCYVD